MTAPTLDSMMALERQVWEALVTGDAETDRALLAPEFLGVYATGFGDREEHVAQLAGGPTVAEYRLDEAQLLHVAEDVVLLAYRASYCRVGPKENAPLEQMLVSSLWRLGPDGWRNLFSQDTAAGSTRPV